MDDVVRRARRAVAGGVAHGMVVAWRAGERVDAVAVGTRGPGGAPLDARTPFPVASITKPLTGALVAALGRTGRLDLHAPVLGDASLRDLIRHAGGVGPDWPITQVEDLERTERIERLGAPWSYGNPGFWLAGHRAAQAAGTSFAGALRAHVLEPAGTADTRAEPWAEEAPGALAHDAPDPAGSSYLRLPPWRIPSGGARATAHDVLAFAAACWPGGPLGDLGLTEDRVPAYGGREYGAGLEIWSAGGTLVCGHSGVTGGFRARLWSVPARRFAVTVLAVGEESEDEVLAIALDAVEDVTGLREPAPAAGPSSMPASAYAGTYARRSGRYEVSEAGGSLRVRSFDVDPDSGAAAVTADVVADPVGQDRFLVHGTSAPRRHVEFLRDAEGAIAFLRVGLVAARAVPGP